MLGLFSFFCKLFPVFGLDALLDVVEGVAGEGLRLDEGADEKGGDNYAGAGQPVEHLVVDESAFEKQDSCHHGDGEDEKVSTATNLVAALALHILAVLVEQVVAVGFPPGFEFLFGHSVVMGVG